MREGCELCLMLYGMENQKTEDLCNSKNCIAVVAGTKGNKPDFVLIIPKVHEMDMDRVKRQRKLRAEMEALIRRAKRILKEDHNAKSFRLAWCSGGMLLTLNGNKRKKLGSVKAHAHCKMYVFYK